MFVNEPANDFMTESSSYSTRRTVSTSSNKLLRATRRNRDAPTSKIPWLKAPSRALVVGINEYKADFISNLRGCVADANDVVSFLTQKLAMPAQNILLLTSPASEPHKKATRAAIIDGIQNFLSQTPPGEEALFYFSGHGSTCQLSEEISFGYEKGYTLVPSDARQDGIVDLMNRELRYLIAELMERGIRLTMIADSCHAGRILREQGARFTASNQPIRTFDSLLDGIVDYERLTELYDGATLPYTLIAGCLPHQSSYEIRHHGKIRGAMTLTLLEVLRSSNNPLTYQEIGKIIRAKITQYPNTKNQYPDIVGDQDRLIFGTDEIVRPQALFVVQKVHRNKTIRVEASLANKPSEGSILTSFTDFTFTKKVAQWEVTKPLREQGGLLTTIATKIWGADAKPGTPLLLEDSLSRPTLYFDSNTEPVANAWRNRQPVAKGWRTRQSPKIVYLREIPINDAHVTVQAVDTEWVVRQRDGNILMRQPQTPDGTKQITELIDQVVSYKDFEALLSPPKQQLNAEQAQLGVNLTATLLDYAQKKEISLAVGEHPLEPFPLTVPLPDKHWYKKESQICLVFSNPSSERLYVYPYLLDAERYEATSILSSEEAEFAAGETRTIFYPTDDDTLSLSIKLLVSRHPLVLQVSPNHSPFSQKEFRVSTTLPFLPQLTDWDIQSLLVSYDKEATVRALDSSNSRRDYGGRTLRKVESKDKPIIYRSQAKSSKEVSPPSIFFDPNASAVALAWCQTGIKGVRRMTYLAETKEKDADYIVGVEGESWVVWKADDKNQILSQNQNNLRGAAHIAAVIDQVACYAQFEALAAAPTEQLPISLAGAEAGVKMTATLVQKENNQKRRSPLAIEYKDKSRHLRQDHKYIEVKLHNQSPKTLYAYLYQLDGERHVAQKLWPSDDSSELAANEWRVVPVQFTHRKKWKNKVSLKLLVSSEPLEMPKWPCGPKGTDEPFRGVSMKKVRALKPRLIGWAAQDVVIRSLREVELEE